MTEREMIFSGAVSECVENLRSKFRDCHVEICSTPDASAFFEAVIYGVDGADVDRVTKCIHELDHQFFRPLGSLLIPMVVDAEDTKNYYPDVSIP